MRDRLGAVLLLGMVATGVAGCKAKAGATPLSDLNAQQARGHAVFQTRCAGCHFDRKDGPLHGPSLMWVFKKPALPSGAAATDERVRATIQHGRGLMPAMGGTMDEQDMDDLLAYLRTL